MSLIKRRASVRVQGKYLKCIECLGTFQKTLFEFVFHSYSHSHAVLTCICYVLICAWVVDRFLHFKGPDPGWEALGGVQGKWWMEGITCTCEVWVFFVSLHAVLMHVSI
jgi:hypothetical protein